MEIVTLPHPEGFPPTREYLIEAQKSLCDLKDWPMFAPSDGRCYSCRQDCVTERWESELITKCNKCGRAFND